MTLTQAKSKKIDKIAGLKEKLKELALEEQDAADELAEAGSDYFPYRLRLEAETGYIQSLWNDRREGKSVSQSEMLTAYDRRMEVAMEGHPFKERCDEARRWHKVIMRELAKINKEIEICLKVTKARSRVSTNDSNWPSLL